MGANQSAPGSDGQGPQPAQRPGTEVKTCYYELLKVERNASDEEIKRAYRRKALELHPDRNLGDVENATKLFASVQAAYEVLSDPQERAWYDAHRDAILRDEDEGAAGGEHYEHNVRVTTAEEIMRMLGSFHGRLEFSDSPSGFYAVLRTTFGKLAEEEEAACQWAGVEWIAYPSFGSMDDGYEDKVRPFYAAWNGFATKKTFSWKDAYRLSEAPDRRVRRLMEKENRKLREDGIREFNDAVRSLVAFVRKRDPRYVANAQSEADRQKSLREAAAAQAARSRAANQAKLAEHIAPEWTKIRDPGEMAGEDSDTDGAEDEEPEEHYECVACGKTFKSEKQFEAHERSKKHLKMVWQLRKRMEKEDKALGLKHSSAGKATLGGTLSDGDEGEDVEEDDEADGQDEEPVETQDTEPSSTPGESKRRSLSPLASDIEASGESEDDDYAPRSAVEARFADPVPSDQILNPVHNGSSQSPSSLSAAEAVDGPTAQPKKTGNKARDKRAKRAAATAAAASASGASTPSTAAGGGDAGAGVGQLEHSCVVCGASFASKTKLFAHVRERGHAAPVTEVKGREKAGKRGRKVR